MSIHDLDLAHLWHPYAPTVNPPPVLPVVSASGTRLKLEDGTELIDAISSWWCMAHGHNHPAIMEAIRKETESLSHVMFAGFTHQPAAELASELAALLPPGLTKYFYADSGSIAVECAAKLAIQYQYALGRTSRCKLAALKGGYHGDTIGAMSLSDPNGMHTIFQGVLPKQYFAEQPACRFGAAWEPSDFDSMRKILEEHESELAAVIVEPIFQGANGMWFYHPEYLKTLAKACAERGVLLIFDEIATGFGRTGRLFARDYAEVSPDIMCLGKILSGGAVTLACAAASEHVAEVVSDGGHGMFLHGPTFMANPLACAAATASLRLLQSYDWRGNTARIERELKAGLEPARTLPSVRDVRVLGAIGVLEMSRMPARDVVLKTVLETGVWLRPFANFIYTMPPFITTTDETARICGAMSLLASRAGA